MFIIIIIDYNYYHKRNLEEYWEMTGKIKGEESWEGRNSSALPSQRDKLLGYRKTCF